MLDGGIIQRLLEEKWKTFARVCLIINSIRICTYFKIFRINFLRDFSFC